MDTYSRATVKLDLQATGSLSQYVGETIKKVKTLSDLMKPVNRPSETFRRLGMGHTAGDKTGYSGTREALQKILGRTGHTGGERGASPAEMFSVFGLPKAKPAIGAMFEKLGTESKSLVVGLSAATVAATGFAMAVEPIGKTLTTSLQLLAGEIGIMLAPAVVSVSRFLQNLASGLQGIGAFVAPILNAVAVPATIILLGAAVTYAGRWVWTMASAAAAASNSLSMLAISAGLARGTAGGGAAATMGAAGALGRIGAGAVAFGVADAVGGAVGGPAGGYIGSAGKGAAIGGTIGSFIPVIGTVVGAVLGGAGGIIYEYFSSKAKKDPAISLNFQNFATSIEGMDQRIQEEALRDPAQTALMEQQIRAMQDLTNELAAFRNRPNQPVWQVGG